MALYSDLGSNRAEQVVCRTMEELSARLRETLLCADDDRDDALVENARRLGAVAEQIGMSTLMRISQDVVKTTLSGDKTAQAATLARLARIGDRSLTAVWDLRDMTV
ncbi:MAG: hypothetical protein WBH04_09180 [Albidovulum sp.]